MLQFYYIYPEVNTNTNTVELTYKKTYYPTALLRHKTSDLTQQLSNDDTNQGIYFIQSTAALLVYSI